MKNIALSLLLATAIPVISTSVSACGGNGVTKSSQKVEMIGLRPGEVALGSVSPISPFEDLAIKPVTDMVVASTTVIVIGNTKSINPVPYRTLPDV